MIVQQPQTAKSLVRDTDNRPQKRARVHWHEALTHFPISLFGTAFLFQVLHLFMFEKAFELSTTVCVLAGAASVVPATVTGWLTWKRRYHGASTRLFRRKIGLAFSMLVVSIPLAVWRVTLYYLYGSRRNRPLRLLSPQFVPCRCGDRGGLLWRAAQP
jgi:uncharacterized membrane protein